MQRPNHFALRKTLLPILLVTLALVACEDRGRQPTAPRLDATAPVASSAPSLSFSQLSIDYDGDLHPLSEWGEVAVTYTGSSNPIYFNLVVNGTWVVRNVPLPSLTGPSATDITSFDFDLGVQPGTMVTSLDYAADITPTPLDFAPQGATLAAVQTQESNMFQDIEGGRIVFGAPGGQMMGGAAAAPAAAQRNFPNQEAGVNECAPAATSNSLQWLDAQNNLGINPALISIAAMKQAQGFNPNTGVPATWPQRKAAYLERNKIPISTTMLPNVAAALRALQNGCDVELTTAGPPIGHAVAIVGITPMRNGNYTITVAHDQNQGRPGGTVTQNLVFNVRTGRLSGAPWANGRGIAQLVAECKK